MPVPLPGPLTYEVPAGVALPEPGVRVRVPVGRRKLTGVVVGSVPAAPEGVATRPFAEVLDLAPVLPADLLELGRFVAEYYLAPLGEVLRSMAPADLEPWGRQRVRVTDRGALALPRDELEAELLAWLRDGGPRSLVELRDRLPGLDPSSIARLQREGKVVLEGDPERSGARYRTAVELARRPVEELVEACGRSEAGREVVRFLAGLGRPAAIGEVTRAVGCSEAVVRRLVRLEVLRKFTEVQRVRLDGHFLAAGEGASEPLRLRPDQRQALDALEGSLAAGRFAPFLLAGMTGSGKTEVYLQAAEAALAAGRSVLLLVPEIGLVPALARTVEERFGPFLAVLHSGLSPSERRQEWERVRDGRARVVLGARSAVFAPLADLGLVVVDEEQDASYKQDSTPRYHGRDLALVRGERAGATVLLVSATPSMESRHNVARGKLRRLGLVQRAGSAGLPDGRLVDLRESGEARRPGEVPLSEPLKQEIATVLAAGDQVVLLRNRRGYAPILLCRACGEDHRCEECGLPRTFHRRMGNLVCHYCGSSRAVPSACGSCGQEALEAIGAGTERVEERFREEFPGVEVAVLDRDSVRRPGGAAAVLERFSRGQVQVLIGTQMVSKGHHFPRVALAAVLSADSYLGFPDFRAVEKTYSLLTQLAGRAGRGDQPGRFVIQTWHPDHYAIRAALAHDDASFAEEEMRFRRIFHYPPFSRMVHLLLRDPNRERGWQRMEELARRLERHELARGVRISGPAPAPLERLRGRWRFQLLLRAASGRQLRALVAAVTADGPAELVADVDPYDLL